MYNGKDVLQAKYTKNYLKLTLNIELLILQRNTKRF